MRAAWYRQNGNAHDVIEIGELPTPQPGPGEVLVRLVCSGVNPSDVKSRRARPVSDPLIVPHSDGAGVIEAVGPGVATKRIGQRVWLWNAQWQRPMGTACEHIALPEAQAVELPEGTDFAAGACLGIPGLTALQAVTLAQRQGGPLDGKNVLVTGASSSVGHYITQLASQAGARVIGTVGSEAKAEHARAAGLHEAIFYKTEPVAERVKELTGGQGADVVIDMDFSSTATWVSHGLLRPHGSLVCYGSNGPDVSLNFRPWLFGSLSVAFFLVYELKPGDRQRAVTGLQVLLQSGRLKHAIGPRFGLDHTAAAHACVEAGRSIGNVVIDLG